MSAVKLSLLCVVALAAAADDVDYLDWKKTKEDRKYKSRVQPLYQGALDDLDACIAEVEGTQGAAVVQFHNTTKVCQLFASFDTTNDTLTESTSGTDGYTLYYEASEEEASHSITTAGIIATCIMAPIFLCCLIALAFLCKMDMSNITAQIEGLERLELAKEEAVSEHYEKKSVEAEAAAAKEMELK